MRRTFLLLTGPLLALALLAGCKDQPQAAATGPASAAPAAPAPAPATPSIDENAARTKALAAGPGTCEEDVAAIRVLPPDGRLGHDAHFDRIAVHRDAYKACLVAMVRDTTPLPDPGPAPKRTPYAQGDLAYDLLQAVRLIERGECLPSDVAGRAASSGAVGEWLAGTNHRRQLHRCLGKKLGA